MVSNEELKDITEWDSINWGKAISFINQQDIPIKGKTVLEIGSRNGGMSLFFALRGATCVCTDLNIPGQKAEEKHAKWNVRDRIAYAALDANTPPPQSIEKSSILSRLSRF